MSNVPSRTARKGACAAAWSGARLDTDIALTVVTTDTNSARPSRKRGPRLVSPNRLALGFHFRGNERMIVFEPNTASSNALHLGAALLEKVIQACLRLIVGLRDRGHQSLGRKARGWIALGDARQHVHGREVGERRVGCDALGKLKRRPETL